MEVHDKRIFYLYKASKANTWRECFLNRQSCTCCVVLIACIVSGVA